MTRDLFAVALAQVSRLDPRHLQAHYVEQLPLLLLDQGRATCPEIASLPGFWSIHECLSGASRQHWNNPELYPHLYALPSAPVVARQSHINALLVHLGLQGPAHDAFGSHRYLRVLWPRPRVLERVGSELRQVPDTVCRAAGGVRPLLLYRPHHQLFDDVSRYYRGTAPRAQLPDLARRIRKALIELERYSGDLAQALRESTGAIIFTADSLPDVRSYSMRLTYPGAIFTAICEPPELVENLIHEQYHARLWAWWLIERPPDLPPMTATMISPVTGLQKPVATMMQAALIYASLIDYYKYVLGLRQSGASAGRAERRLATLESGAMPLVDALHDTVKGRRWSKKFVTLVGDLLQSHAPRRRRRSSMRRPERACSSH